MILSYFDHEVPESTKPAHMCCDFHSHECICDDCELAQAVADIDVNTLKKQPKAVHLAQDQSCEELKKVTLIFDNEINTKIKNDLIHYKVNLQRELGRGTVGCVGLSCGFSIELIDLVLTHLSQLSSVEMVETILPVYSHKIATNIFHVIQKNTPGNK